MNCRLGRVAAAAAAAHAGGGALLGDHGARLDNRGELPERLPDAVGIVRARRDHVHVLRALGGQSGQVDARLLADAEEDHVRLLMRERRRDRKATFVLANGTQQHTATQ
jgi:hypothetical protein